MTDVFQWLQNWFKSQCDGDWEHEFGVKIETVDNPGWYITINLIGTKCEGCVFPSEKNELNENNWYFCLVRNGNFEASCDSLSLTKVLEIFRRWAESCEKNTE